MLVEHVAISKSFGRVNNYNIDPSQEMVAIGVTNLLGSFFGAYPSTGSFSRTAIQSKAGVRTPASGIITGIIVLLTTYLLTGIFYYIPTATLAAVIIHAVSDLVTPASTIHQFWKVSPLEVFIFLLGVLVSIFSHIENGLYTTVLLSGFIFVYRILKARGRFLGRVKVHSVLDEHSFEGFDKKVVDSYGACTEPPNQTGRSVFLPLDHGDGSNPEVHIDSPYPGVFIYRFSEGFNYPNANSTLDFLVEYIYERTRRSHPELYERRGDRPWNNPGPRHGPKSPEIPGLHRLPTLKAVILDFSAVNNVDITSVQRLIDVRNQLDAYTSPDVVDWHIACINNRWTKRALAAGGFGTPRHSQDGPHQKWKSIFSVAEIGEEESLPTRTNETSWAGDPSPQDEERGKEENDLQTSYPPSRNVNHEEGPKNYTKRGRKNAVVHGLDKPLFHVDLTSAVQSAILNIEARQESRAEFTSDRSS
jgi:sodium-independent sulfate anion transporter 11